MKFPARIEPQEQWKEHYKTLQYHLQSLINKNCRIRIAPQTGLYRRQPGSHYHHIPEIFFQTGGASDFICPGASFRLGTGQVCIMPRGVPHREIPVNLKTPYSILVCSHGAEEVTFIRARSPRSGIIQSITADRLKNKRAVEAVFYLDQICMQHAGETANSTHFNHRALELYLLTLLAELLQHDRTEPGLDPRIFQAEQLVREKLTDPNLTISDLAESMRCSPDHLTRLFRSRHGLSLQTWILLERIALAKHLLQHTSHNIAEVSWACGFNSPSYFIRVFRRFTQSTPRSFRTLCERAVPQKVHD